MSNKYIIPVCDWEAGEVWNYVIIANSRQECEEKLASEILSDYDFDDNTVSYEDFVNYMNDNNILIGEIQDIEEL